MFNKKIGMFKIFISASLGERCSIRHCERSEAIWLFVRYKQKIRIATNPAGSRNNEQIFEGQQRQKKAALYCMAKDWLTACPMTRKELIAQKKDYSNFRIVVPSFK